RGVIVQLTCRKSCNRRLSDGANQEKICTNLNPIPDKSSQRHINYLNSIDTGHTHRLHAQDKRLINQQNPINQGIPHIY
ncbi:hypothetical protein, partial [Xanthomonas nasturtii]|uniref:hypothetical protein n=1 Tax=Xanthomonas nasturtii TaxID=1843581 RepID=UPI002012827B